jgi:mono/diheme cytochrome c family protein
MIQRSKENTLLLAGALAVTMVLGSSVFVSRVSAADDDKPWVAPEASRSVKNPVPANAETIAAGEELFTENCAQCHGDKGKGDGETGKMLKKKPANFTDPKLMALETDGSLFWKMSEGRGPMPSWKDGLSDKERWTLVNYIRKLGKDAAAGK